MTHWACKLAGTRTHGSELEWLGPEGNRIRSTLGEGAVTWAVEVGEEIAAKITQEIPPLGEGAPYFSALRRATTSTTLRALSLVSGVEDADTSLASAEVVEIAQDFASRGLELNDLLRSIRVGYAVLAAALLDAATRLAPSSDTSRELRAISVLLFELLDDFTSVAATAFVDEQSAWAASVSAARFDVATKIVNAEPIDPVHAERVLDYPLSDQHLAIIAWSDSALGSTGHDLRGVINPVLRHWGDCSSTLVIPVGSHTVWAWGAATPTVRRGRRGPLPEFDGTRIVAGQVGAGLDGFRRSHLEARAAERLVRLRTDARHATTAHEDVDLEVMLLSDPDAAHHFVVRHLGPLSTNDPRMAELRSTLRYYFDSDHSLTKVAAAEHISRNTVTYRVQRALRLCAHPPGASTTKLRAALLACDWLAGSSSSQRAADE